LPNVIKIDPYNFELYRFKLGAFFLRHSVDTYSPCPQLPAYLQQQQHQHSF